MKAFFIYFVVGWLITHLAADKYTFFAVLVAVLFDTGFAIAVTIKNGNFARSGLARRVFVKLSAYFSVLLLLIILERLTHDSTSLTAKVAAGYAIACELWSLSAWALILNPDLVFFKLFQKHLKGEIEKKLGTDVHEVLK